MVYDSILFLYVNGNANVFTFTRVVVVVIIYSIILLNTLPAMLIFPFLHFSPFLMTFFSTCFELHITFFSVAKNYPGNN